MTNAVQSKAETKADAGPVTAAEITTALIAYLSKANAEAVTQRGLVPGSDLLADESGELFADENGSYFEV